MNRIGRLLACIAVGAFAAGPGGAGAEGLLGAKPQAAPAAPAPDQPPVASGLATPAAVGSPSAVVRPFYAEGGTDLAVADRSRFVDPAKTVLEKNEALKKSGQGDCLDQNMPLDEVPYDKAALDKSFKSLESINGDDARVVVAFVAGSDSHRLEWKLKKVGGEWKITDLLSVTGEWALSQYQCE
ncbi:MULTISPECIES: hypothetical protein [Phyllobacteriaceae]|uniref:hypothetical protein n=1 Tax=Phyllobacteriaceae TaxID=69277 RepID=UPI0017EFBDC8|nr:hypothetical protein [Mesorhizobium sp. YL-MeA3-2017]MDQ0332810.1 hypothetical protein [Mesorhizobium sp. YL-MeA3-2017]